MVIINIFIIIIIISISRSLLLFLLLLLLLLLQPNDCQIWLVSVKLMNTTWRPVLQNQSNLRFF